MTEKTKKTNRQRGGKTEKQKDRKTKRLKKHTQFRLYFAY